MTLTIKPINQLTASTSKDRLMRIAVDIPNGGGFLLRHVTKETLFKLLGHAIDFETAAGDNAIITADAGNNSIRYLNFGGSSLWLIRSPIFAHTSDGTNYGLTVQNSIVTVGNASANGNLRVQGSATDLVSVQTETLTDDRDVLLPDFDGTIALRPVFGRSTPADAATVNLGALNAQSHRIQIISPAAPLSTLTVSFPTSPKSGQTLSLIFTETVTTLTLSSSSTIQNPLTTATDATRATWVYTNISSIDTWIRTV
jgi:hypothetical protein